MGEKTKKTGEDPKGMMHVLGIDSTSRRLSITLSRDGEIVSSTFRESDRKYMEMIIGDIDCTLKGAGISIGDIDAIGINKGPGDFTGTRIGISIVKTLGWVLDIPVYGINALDILAHSIAFSNREIVNKSTALGKRVIIIPCLDVRKDELYFSLYEVFSDDICNESKIIAEYSAPVGSKYFILQSGDRLLIDADDFSKYTYKGLESTVDGKAKTVIIGGNCIEEYGKTLSGIAKRDRDISIDRKNIFPDKSSLDICVRKSIDKGVPGQRVDPVYAREFVPFGG